MAAGPAPLHGVTEVGLDDRGGAGEALGAALAHGPGLVGVLAEGRGGAASDLGGEVVLRVADKLLHVVVPLLAVVGWAVFGPRGRADRSLLLPSLIFPVGWLAYTLVRGAVAGWYPYPFLDVALQGYPKALLACAGVAVLLIALTQAAISLDRRLPGERG